MNTKSGIFTRGYATRENTAFGAHLVNNIRSHTEKIYQISSV